jgi:hypothetical protein
LVHVKVGMVDRNDHAPASPRAQIRVEVSKGMAWAHTFSRKCLWTSTWTAAKLADRA